MYSQIRKSGVQTTVVIDAEDTDVLVLAAYVANTVDRILTNQTQAEYHWKTTLFDKGTSSDDAHSFLSSIGKTLPVTQAVRGNVHDTIYL